MRVLIVSGGTGGHLFPAIALAEELKERNTEKEILFVISKKDMDIKTVSKRDLKFRAIDIDSIMLRPTFKNLLSILKFTIAFFISLLIILEFKPDIVVGFGGYVSLPIITAALILRKKTLIHEQNVKPGRANKLLSYCVDKIAISFEKTKDFFKKKNVILTGNPLRRELLNIDKLTAIKEFSLSGDKFHILIMGGSQGAHRINLLALETFSSFNGLMKDKLQLIHITGNKDYKRVKDGYNMLGIDARVFSFLDEVGYAYTASDLVIARSGATTISEILFFGLPAILIPYPYARTHQTLNAKLLEDKGCCILWEEDKISKKELENSLLRLYNNKSLLKQMSKNCNRLFIVDSTKKLADLVEGKPRASS